MKKSIKIKIVKTILEEKLNIKNKELILLNAVQKEIKKVQTKRNLKEESKILEELEKKLNEDN